MWELKGEGGNEKFNLFCITVCYFFSGTLQFAKFWTRYYFKFVNYFLSLKSYKSLLGYKLYFDGHVEDLCYHPPQSSASSYSYFLFAVKPTERSKADDGSATYKGFFILKKDGIVHSAYWPCKGGYVFSFTLTIR